MMTASMDGVVAFTNLGRYSFDWVYLYALLKTRDGELSTFFSLVLLDLEYFPLSDGNEVGEPRTIEVGQDIFDVQLEPGSSNAFATGGKEHLLRLWDIEQGKNVWKVITRTRFHRQSTPASSCD